MGQHLTTPPDSDRDPTTPTDQPGPGTRGAQRAERDRHQTQPGGPATAGLIAAFLVALVAVAAAVFTLTNDAAIATTPSNADEAAAIQAEKQTLAAGRDDVTDPQAGLPHDDAATLQAEKAATQADRDTDQAITPDDPTTLQHEKAQLLDRTDQPGGDVPSQADETAALMQEKLLIG